MDAEWPGRGSLFYRILLNLDIILELPETLHVFIYDPIHLFPQVELRGVLIA